MADISKIKIGGSTYNIKDAEAVHKTGNESVAGVKSFTNTLKVTDGKSLEIIGTNSAVLSSYVSSSPQGAGAYILYEGPSALTISANISDIIIRPSTGNIRLSPYEKAYYNNNEIATVNQIPSSYLSSISKNNDLVSITNSSGAVTSFEVVTIIDLTEDE